uniref:Retrotransposon Copia-like N-terminal domain-containing protein n=1 Tax=Nicotiana tabacum TaxID=4097 RepID=A0A1S4D5H8_TOBAC|nr:PREDICTED: uncharacterized protein LOC107826197 [Nicotiana tabacum]
MSNLSKLEFVALDISGKNYLSWVLDAEIHLAAKGLGNTTTRGNEERYDHLKVTVLPRTRYEWMHLWLQDFKTISEYNSVVFRITSQLKLCEDIMNDENLLEKTLTTFHALNMVLQQQYRERDFKKYSELISCLLVAEQHNTLLLKNHEACPTESSPLPEANMAARHDKSGKRQNNNHGHMNVRGHDNDKRR